MTTTNQTASGVLDAVRDLLPALRERAQETEDRRVVPAESIKALAEIGFFCAGMLSYLEAFVIQKWCIYCVWSQIFIASCLVLSIAWAVMNHRQRRFADSAVVSA